MSAIYANASVTIIASDGRDAYSGLAGLQGISGPRAFKQVIFDLDHGAKLSIGRIIKLKQSGAPEHGHSRSISFLTGESFLRTAAFAGNAQKLSGMKMYFKWMDSMFLGEKWKEGPCYHPTFPIC